MIRVSVQQKMLQAFRVRDRPNAAQRQERANFRRKRESVGTSRVIQRFHPEAVAREHERGFRAIQPHERKHTLESLQNFQTPARISAQQDFRVRACIKALSLGF